MKKNLTSTPKFGVFSKLSVSLVLALSIALLFAGCRGCSGVQTPVLPNPSGGISLATYYQDNNMLKMSMQRMGATDLLIKNTDTTWGGNFSVDKLRALLQNIPAGSAVQYKYAIDPNTKRLVLMIKGGTAAAPIIYKNDQFCPRMCD